MKSNSDMACCL